MTQRLTRQPTRRRYPVTSGRISRLDPSRTVTLRRQFQADLARRFVKLRRAIVELILGEDALGLKPHPVLVFHAEGRWQFHSTQQKLSAFQQWIKRQIAIHLIGDQLGEESWWDKYIVEGFRKGAGRAFDDTRPQVREWQDTPEARERLAWYAGTREEFLRSSFNYPASREKVQMLASRTFTDLKGVTDSMAARISHSLVDGLTRGDNPRVIARELVKTVDLSKSRAQTIARTEIVRTHAEGQLDSFERLGVTRVGVMAEWLTAGDSRVCKLCRPLNGVVLKVTEARGLLPRHANCRCAWTPANLGEDESTQKRTRGSIRKAFDASYRAELPKTVERSLGEQKDRSGWGAADRKISRARPTSIFNVENNMKCPNCGGSDLRVICPKCSPPTMQCNTCGWRGPRSER